MLPALAMVLAATLAMSMNFANSPVERYAEDPAGGPEIWYALKNVTPGSTTYNCNTNITEACSRNQPDMSGTQVEPGRFIVNGALPPATP